MSTATQGQSSSGGISSPPWPRAKTDARKWSSSWVRGWRLLLPLPSACFPGLHLFTEEGFTEDWSLQSAVGSVPGDLYAHQRVVSIAGVESDVELKDCILYTAGSSCGHYCEQYWQGGQGMARYLQVSGFTQNVHVDMQVGTVGNKFKATKKNHYFKVSGQSNTLFLIKMVCLGD